MIERAKHIRSSFDAALYGLKNDILMAIITGSALGLTTALGSWFYYGSWLYHNVSRPLLYMTVALTGGLSVGVVARLTVGLIGGLGVGSLNHITLVETLSWKWNQFWKRTILGSIVGFFGGLMWRLPSAMIPAELFLGLFAGMIFGLIGGLISGWIGGFKDTVKVDKAFPNQGIKLSRKNFLVVFLITWLTWALIGMLVVALIGWLISVSLSRVSEDSYFFTFIVRVIVVVMTVAVIVGLIGGLNRGGSAVIKSLRVTTHPLAGRTYAARLGQIPRPLRQADSPEEGGRWLHLHPPDATGLFRRSAQSG